MASASGCQRECESVGIHYHPNPSALACQLWILDVAHSCMYSSKHIVLLDQITVILPLMGKIVFTSPYIHKRILCKKKKRFLS